MTVTLPRWLWLLAIVWIGGCASPPPPSFELLTSEVSGTDPALSPNGRWIVFTLLGDLWRLPREGGTAKQLTSGPAYDSRPAFFPDGRLVFQSDRAGNEDLWVLDEIGGEPRQLTVDPAHDSWPTVSPDGAWIVFTSDRAGSEDLWRLPASGGPPRRLTFLPGHETRPSYWRDGLWVVFSYEDVSDADLLELPARGGAARRVFLEDGHRLGAVPAGGRLLYWRLAEWEREAWLGEGDQHQRWPALDLPKHARWRPAPTPEGNWIFYRAGKLWETRGEEVRPIELLAAVQMTQPRAVRPKQGARLRPAAVPDVLDPALSPDGRLIAYSARGDLWIQSRDGGVARRLTAGDFLDRHPVFSPDGQQIAYVSEGHLRTVSVSGGPSRRLSRDSGPFSEPRWLPGGEGLVASRRGPDQRFDIVEVPLEGIGARRLAELEGRQPWRPHPSPAPGGAEVVYHSPEPGVGGLWTVARPPAEPTRELRALLSRSVRAARLSPDGSRLLLIDDGRLAIAPAPVRAGIVTGESLLVEGATSGASWGPEGRSVIVAREGSIDCFDVETVDVERVAVSLPPRPERAVQRRALAADRLWTGRDLIAGGVILIEGDRIMAVGRRGEIELPDGEHPVELGDATLLPGLIDLHVHLGDPGDLVALARAGITTVRDVGGELATRRTLQWMAEDRVVPSPRVLHCGDLLEGEDGVFGNLVRRLASEEEAEACVAELAGAGAWGVKIYPTLPRRIAERVVREAAARNLRATAHVTDARRFFEMVLAGSAGIEHAPTEPIYGDLAALAAAAGVTVTPTIVAVEGAQASVRGQLESRQHLTELLAGKLEGVSTLARAGVRLGAGTDTGLPAIRPGSALIDELELLVAAGLEPKDALAAATTEAAIALGLEREIGRLAPGYVADVLAVTGDPFEDIGQLRGVRWVLRDGWAVVQGTVE